MSFTLSNGKQFNPSGLTKLALLMASMMVLMGSSAVSPALHGIEVELGTSKFLASMVISLPSLVVAVFLAIPYWKSGLDQKNRRRARSAGAEGTDPVWKRRSTHA